MTQSAPPQQKIHYDHAQTGPEEKGSLYAWWVHFKASILFSSSKISLFIPDQLTL